MGYTWKAPKPFQSLSIKSHILTNKGYEFVESSETSKGYSIWDPEGGRGETQN